MFSMVLNLIDILSRMTMSAILPVGVISSPLHPASKVGRGGGECGRRLGAFANMETVAGAGEGSGPCAAP